jgi:hypothetical protein
MDLVTALYVLTFCLVAVLAWAAIRSAGRLWRKAAALAALALLIPLVYLDVTDLLGRPKPTRMAWLEDFREEMVVVGADIREGDAIYLWVRRKDELEPRAYVLKWDAKTAEAIKEASDTARDMATNLMVKLSSDEGTVYRQDDMAFYAEPQRALPEKPDPEDQGMLVEPTIAPAP